MKYVRKFIMLACIFTCFSTLNVYARRGCCSWHGGVSGDCRNGMQVCNDGTTSPSCTCSGGTSTYTPPVVYGCTDYNSINYNPNANRDDGSCIKKVYGCTDSNAFNYNSNANNDDGSCIDRSYGCIDKKAVNFNKSANTADGSCQYKHTKISYKKIKYTTKYKYKLFVKNGKILQKGKNGKKKITKEVLVDENNNIIKSKVIKTIVVKKAVPKIIVKK